MVINEIYMVVTLEKFGSVDISRRTKSKIDCIYKKKPRASINKPINGNSNTNEETTNDRSKIEGSSKIGIK